MMLSDTNYAWRYGYAWRYYPVWPVVYTAPEYVDGCAFEYKTRIRFMPGVGFRGVQVKYCIAII
jgi:hypothetical protein